MEKNNLCLPPPCQIPPDYVWSPREGRRRNASRVAGRGGKYEDGFLHRAPYKMRGRRCGAVTLPPAVFFGEFLGIDPLKPAKQLN
jgi:hypothetical protein